MDKYTEHRLRELRTKIDTCNYNDNGSLIDIIKEMYELLNEVIHKIN